MASSDKVLPGPNQAAITALLQEWAGPRTEKNGVVWDMVHEVPVDVDATVTAAAERIICPQMRSDFSGLSPMHIAALQGRVSELGEAEKLGGRSVWHLAALAGYIRDALPHMSAEEKSELGEYRETPLTVHFLTAERTAVDHGGYFVMNQSYVPAEELLKLWMTTRATETLWQQDRALRRRIGDFKPLTKDCYAVDPETREVKAAKRILANQIIAPVHGVFDPHVMLRLYLDPRFVVAPEIYAKKAVNNLTKADPMMDGTKIGNALNLVSRAGVPNVKKFEVPATEGRPVASYYYALTDIEPGTPLVEFDRAAYECVRADLVEVQQEERRRVVKAILEKGHSVVEMTHEEFLTSGETIALSPYEQAALEWIVLSPQVWARCVETKELTWVDVQGLFRLFWNTYLGPSGTVDLEYVLSTINLLSVLIAQPELQAPFNEHLLQPFMREVGKKYDQLCSGYVEPDYITKEFKNVCEMLFSTPAGLASMLTHQIAFKVFTVDGGIKIRFIFHPIHYSEVEIKALVDSQTL